MNDKIKCLLELKEISHEQISKEKQINKMLERVDRS